MNRVVSRVGLLAKQIKNGDVAGVRADLQQWMWSENYYCGLRRDFSVPFQPEKADVELTAVPLTKELAPTVFSTSDLPERDATYLERRRKIWDAGFANGFVAVTAEGKPAYLQWLIPPSQNDKVADYFGPLFPLDATTLIVEGAWIPPEFRKANVMGEGLSLVTEAAAAVSPEATGAVCFPELRNKGAVRGSARGGYVISEIRTDRWRLGRRTTSFAPATADDVNAIAPGTIKPVTP